VLGINGGDGTIHVTLTTFIQVYGDTPLPKIAILRGGTLNTVATGLGIRGTPQDILWYVIDRYHAGEELPVVERPALRVDDQYGFLFGNGLVANFLEAYYATGRPSPATGAWLMGKTVAAALLRLPFGKKLFRRTNAHVTVDGETWARTDFLTILAATVPQLGIGFTPFHRCWETLEGFALLGIHCGPLGLAMELPRIYRGKPVRRDKAISAVAREVKIVTDEEVPYTIDGDLHRKKGEMTLGTGPVLKLVVPDWRRGE
jgi:diacylglycerol kinase family enzyme